MLYPQAISMIIYYTYNDIFRVLYEYNKALHCTSLSLLITILKVKLCIKYYNNQDNN